MAADQDAHFLQVRQKFAFGGTADLTAGAAFFLVKAFTRNYFSGLVAFFAEKTFS